MVYDYLITLKKRNYNLVDQVSQLLYVFALFTFGYIYYYHPKSGSIYFIIGAGIILAWIYAFLKKKKNGEAMFRFGLFIGAFGWFLGPERNVWMAMLYAVAGLLEKQVKFPAEIGFTNDKITFNSLPQKVLLWSQVKNVLIKDGLLTIDQKNNKLLQKEIEGYVTADVEQEFNNFCQNSLRSANLGEQSVQ